MHSKIFLPALCFCLINTVAHAASISGQGTWESTLQGRDLDGNLTTAEAYYDTQLDITWLADAAGIGINMTWNAAHTWAAGLNINGVLGWRLPTKTPIDGGTGTDAIPSNIGTEDRGYNVSAPGTLYAGSTTNEMAHLFYNTLGNKGHCDPTTSTASICVAQPGSGLSNTGPFSNVWNAYYWSDTALSTDSSIAWFFGVINGVQDYSYKSNNVSLYGWAVHDGDVGVALPTSAVPVPTAAWLLGSGLIGLIGIARKQASGVVVTMLT